MTTFRFKRAPRAQKLQAWDISAGALSTGHTSIRIEDVSELIFHHSVPNYYRTRLSVSSQRETLSFTCHSSFADPSHRSVLQLCDEVVEDLQQAGSNARIYLVQPAGGVLRYFRIMQKKSSSLIALQAHIREVQASFPEMPDLNHSDASLSKAV